MISLVTEALNIGDAGFEIIMMMAEGIPRGGNHVARPPRNIINAYISGSSSAKYFWPIRHYLDKHYKRL
jgi:hypothetical protein